jgi:hypothetical protein
VDALAKIAHLECVAAHEHNVQHSFLQADIDRFHSSDEDSIRNDGARGGGRTHTSRKGQGILSPPRMPFRHPGVVARNLPYQKLYCNVAACAASPRDVPVSLVVSVGSASRAVAGLLGIPPARRRFRLHDGLRTAPKAPEGIECIRSAVKKHVYVSERGDEELSNLSTLSTEFSTVAGRDVVRRIRAAAE